METFPSKNIAITWVEKGSLARNLFLSFGFAILTALSAQIRIELPFTPVPVTAQTFVVILAGLILGSTFGSLSMLMYLFTGLAGLPFFSGSVAGLAILRSPTIGYIIYMTGVVGLMMILNISMVDAFSIGVIPFMIGDMIKAALAVLIAYQIR